MVGKGLLDCVLFECEHYPFLKRTGYFVVRIVVVASSLILEAPLDVATDSRRFGIVAEHMGKGGK